MKKNFNLKAIAMLATMACGVAVMMTSCDNDPVPPKVKILTFVTDNKTFKLSAVNADSIVLDITSSDTTWNVRSIDTGWITAKSDKESEKVTITVIDNDSEGERTGKVIIEFANNEAPSDTITIIQEGKAISLSVSDFDGVFAPDAYGETSAKELYISSNHPWTIEDLPEWLAFNEKEGSEGKTVKVWPSSFNVSSTDREATVKIKSGSKETEIRIVQEHLIFDISDTELTFDFFCAGQKYAKEIIITCNASSLEAFYVKPNWLGTEEMKVINEDRIIKVWPNSINSTASGRSVVLTVKAAGVEKNVKIVQTNNEPWSFCPDITLGLDRTSDEILAIFGDDGTMLEEQIGYLSYNENIMALVFALDSNNTCDNAMSQFRSAVSNDQVINHCNSHYETDVMIDLALMVYNQQNWKGWAKHDKDGEITAMIIYDTERKVLTATTLDLNDEKGVKGKYAAKETRKAIMHALTKMTEELQKQR